MAEEKPKSKRHVAPYGEEAMRSYSVRLTKAQYEYFVEVGEGNLSLGVRRVIERIMELERTLPAEEWQRRLQAAKAKRAIRNRVKITPTANGRGRPALSAEKIKAAQDMYAHQGRSVKEIAEALQIHISTFYKYVDVRRNPNNPVSVQ
ncbi:hypothetical protein RugamoR64_29210 [Duganella rhizosphaerae]|uniref:hypothetical protein n=1 Tax=Duganella rhizosphaerae TaxID=2885763 RepID=UPI0030EA03CE